jgi:hypothetical protein
MAASWAGWQAGQRLEGVRIPGPGPLTEEARKDSLETAGWRDATRPFPFAGRGYAALMGERETDGAQDAAQQEQQDVERAKEEMHELEQGDPPEKLEDWPDGKAKYITYGGPEGTAGYDEGPTQKLGPSSLEHHEDGSVTIEGEQVDDPGEYKTDPIPGSPADDREDEE